MTYAGSISSKKTSKWNLLQLYARTVVQLRPIQIYSRVRPKHFGVRHSAHAVFRRPTGPWSEPIRRASPQIGPKRFRLLNQEYEIRTWDDPDLPHLWKYNLHYFSHCDLPLIMQWISDNPIGSGIGWDPYPTSLRIANWCKWGLTQQFLSSPVCDSLAAQTSWLQERIETHILANHLLANAKALIFAGLVLESATSSEWRDLGFRLLQEQLSIQILHDGAHVERSPMYHSIILEDLLDIINLACAYETAVPQLRAYVPRMLSWLQHLSHPDGEIAFFQ